MVRPLRKRVNIDVPEVFHKMIKDKADSYKITITRFMLRAAIEKIKREGNPT